MGAKVLCRFEKIPALEVVTGNVNVRSLPTINVGQVEGGEVEKIHSPEGANSSAYYVAVGTSATFIRQGGRVWERVRKGVNVELVVSSGCGSRGQRGGGC